MAKISISAVIALGLWAAVVLSFNSHRMAASIEEVHAGDAAFRDGLYLGRLAAECGNPMRPAIGRWSNEADRALFRYGYRYGYNTIARTKPQANPALRVLALGGNPRPVLQQHNSFHI